MDTRRLPGTLDPTTEAAGLAAAFDVEIVELSAVDRPRRVPLGRVAVVVAIGLLAGLVAMAGIPSRTSFALEAPLSNVLSPNTAP